MCVPWCPSSTSFRGSRALRCLETRRRLGPRLSRVPTASFRAPRRARKNSFYHAFEMSPNTSLGLRGNGFQKQTALVPPAIKTNAGSVLWVYAAPISKRSRCVAQYWVRISSRRARRVGVGGSDTNGGEPSRVTLRFRYADFFETLSYAEP